jgi:hypothetical protein
MSSLNIPARECGKFNRVHLNVWNSSDEPLKRNISLGRKVMGISLRPRIGHFFSGGFFPEAFPSSVGTIRVVTAALGSYGSKSLRVYDQNTGILIKKTQSQSNGYLELTGLSTEKEFMVVAVDDNVDLNAAVQARLKPI